MNNAISEIELAQANQIDNYDHILYGLNFCSEVLNAAPDTFWASDDTQVYHCGERDENIINNTFYKFGYALPSTEELLWHCLREVEKEIKFQLPTDFNAFWAVPNHFCISHSHPARDYFRIESLATNLAFEGFDLIIDMRTRERDASNPNNSFFRDKLKEYRQSPIIETIIIADDEPFAIPEITAILNIIDTALDTRKKRILLHSQGRTDRLALILACWLVKHKLATTETFIDKIAQLREGFWVNPIIDPDSKTEYWEINKYFLHNCDQTRPFDLSKGRLSKARKMSVVPFLFSKQLKSEIKYDTQDRIGVNYEVDADILEIIAYFSN